MDDLQTYMEDVSRIELMNKDTETAIVTRIANGDDSARMELVEGCLRAAIKIALSFGHAVGHGGLDRSDLIQMANLGLIKAAFKFDPKLGYRFTTFAIHVIRHVMYRSINESRSTIRVPAARIQCVFSDEWNQDCELNRAAKVALTEPLPIEDSRILNTPSDSLIQHDRESAMRQIDELHASITELMQDVCSDREIDILIARSHGETLIAIGDRYGLSRERIRQIEAKAIIKIRKVVPKKIEECFTDTVDELGRTA